LKSVVRSLAEKSASFIVMNKLGVDILRKDYGVRNDIRVVPHGIPDVELVSPLAEKKKLGFEDNIVLSSFGMISSGKGYEYVIDSLPEVVKLFPNIVYLIMGETHPVVRKEEGEKYRNFLEKKVKKLGLQNNVKFYNKYLKLSEIISYLKATDVYISSSLNPNQITSGTLVYSLGTGRPVISTPFLHAKEILNDSIGRFASFKSSRAYSKAIIELLSNDNLRKEMGKVAYAETRKMTWNNVAKSYMDIFNEKVPITEKYSKVLPKIKLGHLLKLTDSFGIIQFSKNTKPDINSGYTLDDNARALSFCCDYLAVKKDEKVFGLLETYFNFIKHVQSEDGSFSNLVDKERAVDADSWSSDAFGRAIWSLGILFSS
jgi:hypothetical protein